MNPEDERAITSTSTPRLPPAATSALPTWSPSQNHQGRGLSNPNAFSPHPFSPSAAAPLPPPNAATAAPPSRFISTNAPGVQENSASSAPLVQTYQPHDGFAPTTTQPGAPVSGLTQPDIGGATGFGQQQAGRTFGGIGSSSTITQPPGGDIGGAAGFGQQQAGRTFGGIGSSSTITQPPGGDIGDAAGFGQQHTVGTGISGRPQLSTISEETPFSSQFSGDGGAEPQQLGGNQNVNAGVADAKAEIVDLLRGAAGNIDRAKSIAKFSMDESQRLAFLQRQVPDVLRGRIRNGASLLGGGNHRQDQGTVASHGGTTAMSISYARDDGAAMAGTLWNRMEDPEHCSVSREKLKNAGKLFKCTDAEECREKIYKMQLDEILGKLGELKKRRFQDSAPYILNLSYNKEIPQRHPIISDPKSDFWGMNDIEKKENVASWVICMLLSPRFPVKIPDKLKARYQRDYRGKKADGTW